MNQHNLLKNYCVAEIVQNIFLIISVIERVQKYDRNGQENEGKNEVEFEPESIIYTLLLSTVK